MKNRVLNRKYIAIGNLAERFTGKRKYGFIAVSFDTINEEMYKLVFEDVFIIKAQEPFHYFGRNIIEYLCWSEHFDIVEDGEKIPEYKVFMQTHKDGSVTRERFERWDT